MTNDLASTTPFHEIYATMLACYVVVWLLFFALTSRLKGHSSAFLPVGFSHRKLKLFGLAALWPAFLVLIPATALAMLVWISLPRRR